MRIEMANERHGAAQKRDEAICGKVHSVRDELGKRVGHAEDALDMLRNTIVGRWTFWVVIGLMVTGIGGMGFQQNYAFRQIMDTQHQTTAIIDRIFERSIKSETKIEALTTAVEVLGKRQDILRDQNLKILDDLKGR